MEILHLKQKDLRLSKKLWDQYITLLFKKKKKKSYFGMLRGLLGTEKL